MADISPRDKNKLEKLLGMGSGFVLWFSNASFELFFNDFYIEIYNEEYSDFGTSKANRMRCFLKKSSNSLASSVLSALIGLVEDNEHADHDDLLIKECKRIANELRDKSGVLEHDCISSQSADDDFELVASHVREAIRKNDFTGGIDRLHTYMQKFIRFVASKHGIEHSKEKPLHSVFGEYVKIICSRKFVETEMSQRILRSAISLLESFNYVRNNKSLAHDNTLLNHDESLFIFNGVIAIVTFINSIEQRMAQGAHLSSSK